MATTIKTNDDKKPGGKKSLVLKMQELAKQADTQSEMPSSEIMQSEPVDISTAAAIPPPASTNKQVSSAINASKKFSGIRLPEELLLRLKMLKIKRELRGEKVTLGQMAVDAFESYLRHMEDIYSK